jgi:pyrroline-5-carboxylate reductase
MSSPRIGFIGAGRMAAALAGGIIRAGLAEASDIVAADPSPDSRRRFKDEIAGQTTDDNCAVLEQADVVFLAVKPQHMAAALGPISAAWTDRHLIVSIAAGVTLDTLERLAGKKPRYVRVMPNTPCLVGYGASGYCLGPGATDTDGQCVKQMLEACGAAYEVSEPLLDAVTGLSGSGPAFVYLMIDALADGGVRAGLPRDVALALAARTVRGAAEMVLTTGRHPATLKDEVTSPGGTTIAGLQALEDRSVRAAMIAAVEAATRRSQELGGR